MDPLQTLTDAIAAFQRNNMSDCEEALIHYWEWRNKGGFEPQTTKFKVKGDEIAEALLTLVRARLTAYLLVAHS